MRKRTIDKKKNDPGSGLFSAEGCPSSIVGAEAFHFRVRDGNGWGNLALTTRAIIHKKVGLVAGEGFEPPTFGL
jgi:hypothetical protein